MNIVLTYGSKYHEMQPKELCRSRERPVQHGPAKGWRVLGWMFLSNSIAERLLMDLGVLREILKIPWEHLGIN